MDSCERPKHTGGASRTRPTGTVVGAYRLGEKIAESGASLVYKAVDTRIGRTAALAFVHPDLTRDPAARSSFIRDARIASSIASPNICKIFGIDETDDGGLYLATAYEEGETLASRAARGPLGLDEAVGIAAQIAQGLSKAHARGIVHRGIEPASIFIARDGAAKIRDFALARLAADSRRARGAPPGEATRYLSLEQERGDEPDERDDIWSLCARWSRGLSSNRTPAPRRRVRTRGGKPLRLSGPAFLQSSRGYSRGRSARIPLSATRTPRISCWISSASPNRSPRGARGDARRAERERARPRPGGAGGEPSS